MFVTVQAIAVLKGNSMFAVERKRLIKNYINDYGKVLVVNLSRMLGVSEVTIRRDLELLEKEGFLRRTHGGAVLSDSEVERRSDEDEDEIINEIAVVAARFVQDGDNICITNGVTNSHLARKLAPRNNLTVLTNDISIASEMASQGKKVVLLGGEFDSDERASFGTLAIDNLRKFFVSKVFMEVDGVNKDLIFSVNSPTKASFLTAVMAEAQKLIIVCPFTRFQDSAFYSMGKIPSYNIVTNARLEDSFKRRFFEEGISLFTSVDFGNYDEIEKTSRANSL